MKNLFTLLFVAIFSTCAYAQTATSDTISTVRNQGEYGYTNLSLRGSYVLDHEKFTLGAGVELLKPFRYSTAGSTNLAFLLSADILLRDTNVYDTEISNLHALSSFGIGLSQMFHMNNSNFWITVAPMINWNFYETHSRFSYLSLYGAANLAFSNNMFIGAFYKHEPFITDYDQDKFSQVGINLGYQF